MRPPHAPRRRKRERRGMRGGLEDRRPVQGNLELRGLASSKKPLLRSETGENDPRGSRLRPFVGPGRAYGTPDFDPSEPIPFVLTWKGIRATSELTPTGAALPLPATGHQACRVCGCTDDDCLQCIQATGEPCTWVRELETEEGPLCSRCAERRTRSFLREIIEEYIPVWDGVVDQVRKETGLARLLLRHGLDGPDADELAQEEELEELEEEELDADDYDDDGNPIDYDDDDDDELASGRPSSTPTTWTTPIPTASRPW